MAFARQFVHQIVNVSPINYVYTESVNQHATIIQPAQTFNTARTMCARKRFDAAPMMIVRSTNVAKLIRTADQSAKMLAKDDSYADEMPNARPETTRDCVHVNKASPMTVKVDVVVLNANATMNAVQTSSAKRIFANWCVKAVDRAEKKQFAPVKTIGRFAIANRATVETHMNNVMPLIIAVTPHVDHWLNARITKEHSIVRAAVDTLAIHTMKAVAWHSNAKAMPIVHRVPNVFNQTVNQNVEMFAKMSAVVQTPTARRLTMLATVNVCRDMVANRPTRLLVADRCQFHAHCRQTVRPIRIVTVAFVSQHVF